MSFFQEINVLLVCPEKAFADDLSQRLSKVASGITWHIVMDWADVPALMAVQHIDAVVGLLRGRLNLPVILSGMDKLRALTIPILMLADQVDKESEENLLWHGVEEILPDTTLEPEVFVRALRQSIIRNKTKQGQMQASQTRFREIIEGNSDGMLVVGDDGNIVFANPAVGKIFDINLNEIVGKKFDFYILTKQRQLPSQDLENLSHKYISLLSTTGNTTELEVDNEQGEVKSIEMKASRIPWQGVNAFLVHFHDVTQTMKLQRLKAEIFERERVTRMKDEFISTVSHEIRTPLAIVKCAIENMRDGIVGIFTDKQNRIIKIASSNVDRLTKLIDDILDLSKLEAGKITMQLKPVSFNKLLEDTVRRFKLLASERNVRIQLDVPFSLPVIYADPDRITQVIDNLLSNALKFSQGQIRISARFVEDVPAHPVREVLKYLNDKPLFVTPGQGVELIIHDDGPGVPVEKRHELFNKFVQLDRADGGAGYKGTGLGLSICKEIVEMHQGVIWVDGDLGKGADFHFLLPENPKNLAAGLPVEAEPPIVAEQAH